DLGIVTDDPINEEFTGSDLTPLLIQTEESAEGETTAADLGILFNSSQQIHDGGDLDPRITLNMKLSDLRSGLGITFSMIRIANGQTEYDLDFSSLEDDSDATIKDLFNLIEGTGAGVEMNINSDKNGITISSTHDGQSFVIYDTSENGTASQLGIAGSPDLVGSLLYLADGLQRNWVDTGQRVVDRLQMAQDQILVNRSSVGSRINRVDHIESNNLNQEVYTTQLLSDVEDADFLSAVTELSMQEVVYQAALATSARVIQSSLVNFLS
ncbi:MAG: hypothetical protein GF315_13210, partial [candidate division Zixibacteria bacterium]|nr:hypothetical protein [candidate division Zixibacteria bacterium]